MRRVSSGAPSSGRASISRDSRRDAVPANAGAKNSDPAASCGRIAGREQRRRRGRERPACALLQPNYGAK